MFRIWLSSFLILVPAAFAQAQPASTESPATVVLISEIRQLRQDLQTTAAVIQRVQIVMYRLQAESNALESATQRRDGVRSTCSQYEFQQRRVAAQIEQIETQQRTVQDTNARQAIADQLPWLKTQQRDTAELLGKCAGDQAEAENNLRSEQAKMADLQQQLDKLDKALAALH